MKVLMSIMVLGVSLSFASASNIQKVEKYKHIYIFAKNSTQYAYLDILGHAHYVHNSATHCDIGTHEALKCKELFVVEDLEIFKNIKEKK